MKSLFVTMADGNYVPHAKVVFSSLFHNAGWQGDLMLLVPYLPGEAWRDPDGKAKDLSAEDTAWFTSRGIIVRHYPPFHPKKVGVNPQAVLGKLHLFDESFKAWDQIVFVDADVVIRGSLQDLTAVESLGAVRVINYTHNTMRGQFWKFNKEWRAHLGEMFELDRPAFNAGMLAFSTSAIKPDTLQKFREIIKKYEEVIYISEEAVLNIYFYGKWQELPAVYNICPRWESGFRRCGPEGLHGIVCHNYSKFFPARYAAGKMWMQKHPIYPLWKSQLDKADAVDFNSERPAAVVDSQNYAEHSQILLRLREDHPFIWRSGKFFNYLEKRKHEGNVFWKIAGFGRDATYYVYSRGKDFLGDFL